MISLCNSIEFEVSVINLKLKVTTRWQNSYFKISMATTFPTSTQQDLTVKNLLAASKTAKIKTLPMSLLLKWILGKEIFVLYLSTLKVTPNFFSFQGESKL